MGATPLPARREAAARAAIGEETIAEEEYPPRHVPEAEGDREGGDA